MLIFGAKIQFQNKLTLLFAMYFAFFTNFVLDINSEFVVCLTLIHHDVSELWATEKTKIEC